MCYPTKAIGKNIINNEGAISLIKALKENKVLTKINLGKNKPKFKVVMKFMKMIYYQMKNVGCELP